MSFPVISKADPANWLLPFGTVNMESEFTYMRVSLLTCDQVQLGITTRCVS